MPPSIRPLNLTVVNSSTIPSSFAVVPITPRSALAEASAPDTVRISLYDTSIIVSPETGQCSFNLFEGVYYAITGCYRKDPRPGGQVYVSDAKPLDKSVVRWTVDMPEGHQPYIQVGARKGDGLLNRGDDGSNYLHIGVLPNFSWPHPAWPFVGLGVSNPSGGGVIPLVTWDAQPGRNYGLNLTEITWSLGLGRGQLKTIIDESVWTLQGLEQVIKEQVSEAKFVLKSNGTMVRVDTNENRSGSAPKL